MGQRDDESQIAMLTAKVYPEPEHKSRPEFPGKTETDDFSAAALSKARKVLRYLPALADSVAAGDTSLKDAYEAALAEEARIAAHASAGVIRSQPLPASG